MTGLRFALRLALREGRSSRARLLLLTTSIAVGVAALVALRAFTANLQDSVRTQARVLLGADVVLGSGVPFSPRAEQLGTDLLQAAGAGARLSRVATFGSMAWAPERSGTRLVQVIAVQPGYPFYGSVVTDPADAWAALPGGSDALVDEAVLPALEAQVGDAVVLGKARFRIAGVVKSFPGDVGMRSALGPRVFIPWDHMQETGLLGFGARVRHEGFLQLGRGTDPERLAARFRGPLSTERVTIRTVREDQRSLGNTLGRMSSYLALVALMALLLGGVGVASAVHVFVRRKREAIAVLRCLGATGAQVLLAYLLQTGAVALLGSLAGALAGVVVQAVMPRLLRGLLPVDVQFSISPSAIASGVGLGVLIALLFALLPLLTIRQVSPLVLLRPAETPRAPRDPWRWLAIAMGVAGVVLASVSQAPSPGIGVGCAAGIGVVLAVLALAARLLTSTLRATVSPRWPYVLRQGLANLHRPGNQTLAVVLALGFGTFLLAVIVTLQHNLLNGMRVDGAGGGPNLVLFDVQPDQRAPLADAVRGEGGTVGGYEPIVPMRIASVDGQASTSRMASGGSEDTRGGWAFRREYRSTWRDDLRPSEKLTAGAWWAPGSARTAAAGAPVPVSVEVGVAKELGVRVGSTIVWDVQGVQVPSRVASLREVAWARFEPNFFVVFPDGPLLDAPQTFVTLTRLDDPAQRARLQRGLVQRFPNVTVVDLTEVQKTVEGVVSRVAAAIRFMALFSLLAGASVLAGAIAASREQRRRDAAVLRAVGASSRQLRRIAATEYVALGTLGAAVGGLLSTVASWALVRFVFDAPFGVPAGALAALCAGVAVMAVGQGLLQERGVLRRPALEILRAE